ncbi:MAG: TIGR01906 family membrane protein [Candidatus Nanoarchaeia archaeon]
MKKLQALLSLSLFFLILFGTLYFVSFDKEFYVNKFEHYNVYPQFEEDKTTINQEFFNVLDYLKYPWKNLESNFFNEKERAHLIDVKRLYLILEVILFLSLIVFIGSTYYFLKNKLVKSYTHSLILGSSLVLAFFLFLTTCILINFEQTFILFHKLLFTNDLWMLNPETDNLIKLLPEELFFYIAQRFVLWSSGIALLILLTSLLSIKFFHKKVRN